MLTALALSRPIIIGGQRISLMVAPIKTAWWAVKTVPCVLLLIVLIGRHRQKPKETLCGRCGKNWGDHWHHGVMEFGASV